MLIFNRKHQIYIAGRKRTPSIPQIFLLIISKKKPFLANQNTLSANRQKNHAKIPANQKGGCCLYYPVMPCPNEYFPIYIERLFAPVLGMDERSFFISGHPGKITMIGGLDVQEKQYAPDKPDDCSRCFFWNGTRSGCSLGQNNCYYLIEEAPKVHSECEGCPYGRDRPCIGWCTKKIMRELGIR